jgi:hypothetical protein
MKNFGDNCFANATSLRWLWGLFRIVAFAATIAIFVNSESHAATVGQSPFTTTLYRSVSDDTLFFAPINANYCDTCGGVQEMYATFTLSSRSMVTSISFDVSNDATFFPNWFNNPLTLAVYNVGAGGGPGTNLFSQTFTPNSDASITFNLSNVTALVTYDEHLHLMLNEGNYFITYYSLDGLGAVGFLGGSSETFAVTTPGTVGPLHGPVSTSLGFKLDGFTIPPVDPVPLPGALPLFASGLAGLGLLGWRRKKIRTRS